MVGIGGIGLSKMVESSVKWFKSVSSKRGEFRGELPVSCQVNSMVIKPPKLVELGELACGL